MERLPVVDDFWLVCLPQTEHLSESHAIHSPASVVPRSPARSQSRGAEAGSPVDPARTAGNGQHRGVGGCHGFERVLGRPESVRKRA